MKTEFSLSNIISLSFSLAKTNFKLRNEGSYFGLLWYILNPLALFLIILFIKNEAFRNVDIEAYPIYLLVGLLVFNFFTQTLSAMVTVISSYGGLIKSVKLNTEALIIGRVLQSAFSHIFEVILLCIVSFALHLPAWGILLYIFGFIVFFFFVLGLSFVFATVGLFVNDLGNVWTAISQALFFVTPIFFVPVVGTSLWYLNMFNPLNYFLQFFRTSLVEGMLPSGNILAFGLIVSIVSMCFGLGIFYKYKHRFAELV